MIQPSSKIMKIFITFSLIIICVKSFSVPTIVGKTYFKGDPIEVFAHELDSVYTQIPLPYYYLNYCPNTNNETQKRTLGSRLLGQTTDSVPFFVNMGVNVTCRLQCEINYQGASNFIDLISNNYQANLVIDGLPSISGIYPRKSVGFPLGYIQNNEAFIYNHLDFTIWHKGSQDQGYKIIKFIVTPKSVGIVRNTTTSSTCEMIERNADIDIFFPQIINPGMETYVTYSHSVNFIEIDAPLSYRWDYLNVFTSRTFFWTIALAVFIISVIVTCIVEMKLGNRVQKDLGFYNELGLSTEIRDSGWKQYSRDVFRPPTDVIIFSALTGTGVQLGSMAIATLAFLCTGITDNDERGTILSLIILMYNFMGGFAGHRAVKTLKVFRKGDDGWLLCSILTGTFYPAILFCIFMGVNTMIVPSLSSLHIDHKTLLVLSILWLGISMPLVILGGFIAQKRVKIENPFPYESNPTPIRGLPWYLKFIPSVLLSGFLPFAFGFPQIVAITVAFWDHDIFNLFGPLLVTILMLLIVSAEISTVFTFANLCHGNHRIWWKSFVAGGSIAFYFIMWTILYPIVDSDVSHIALLPMYYAYMFMVSLGLFFLCGTMGFLSSYVFVHKIYTLVK